MYFPSATYRVQLNSHFTFHDVKSIIPYLHKLGISTVYGAPVTASMKGSTHGYDVCNPDILNSEIGNEQQFEEIAERLKQYGMGWLQDIVPNHMAFICDNWRLMDILERGPKSPYYHYFDINWQHPDPVYKGKLMVPFIGKDLAEAIDSNEIKIVFDDAGFYIAYFNDYYPVAADTHAFVFSFSNNETLSEKADSLLENIDISFDDWKQSKAAWIKSLQPFINDIQEAVEQINNDKQALRQLLSRQYFMLARYKVTESEINFRRFFTVNQLICLRMEDDLVFNDYHQYIYQLYKKEWIQGLRIDHIDGLYHPQQYVLWLRKLFGEDCYVIAEKILEYNEDIARDWDMQGTSGYEFLSFTSQLLTNKQGAEKLLRFYKELVPDTVEYGNMVFQKKHNFLYSQMGGELSNLLNLAGELKIFENEFYNEENLRKALGILMACFPVYRIYPDKYPLHWESIPIVQKAFDKAGKKIDDAYHELDLLKSIFYTDGTKPEDVNKLLFLMRLMQFTGPLAAKGVEDTTFYVYNPLISHNEVGDAPSTLGITINQFHNKMRSRQKNNPHSLSATSTHDTKRGEDGRMRINILADMADEWIHEVNNWRQVNTPFIKWLNGKPAPTANDEYFIYQSLIGSFPEDLRVTQNYIDRSLAFIEKALREAKVETTYNEPDNEYEDACKNFIVSILDRNHTFLQSFASFSEKVIEYATVYSLAQTIIKITAPGIPDIYQGCELWDNSYVDPDNRRPVDYGYRINALNEIMDKEAESTDAVVSFIQEHKRKGYQKMYVTYKLLNFRRQFTALFLRGDYIPVKGSDNVVAYARRYNGIWIIVILPVHVGTIAKQYGNLSDEKVWVNDRIHLPEAAPSAWKNIFTGETIQSGNNLQLQQVFAKFPVAVLAGDV